MAKKVDKATAEMRKLLTDKKLVIGKEVAIKRLREKKLKRIMIASNATDKTKETLHKFCNLGKVECIDTNYLAGELGIMCKKPYSISVIGVLK